MSSIVSFLSSFVSTVHNDAAEDKPEEPVEEQKEEQKEEEEEEEPEDIHPAIRESCKTTRCAKLAEHFEHCQEKVQSGKGFPHEDCVEELMMHCIDDCAAPTLFEKLV
ncbi:Non-heme 11 kDa protein of cytochrome bc1 complex [Ephemerocybe angulata]|uniref:Non-heme 11 kDa protein of cytochrome bc1 complex n=1 Tax=Ephemerocybe angulata TaxID=980116 RepID=A0A8H6HLX0_9AGAR|nr:Non-heme 11 kDa protein of cytochrome bc1 complex [Tulosesus angulatus]